MVPSIRSDSPVPIFEQIERYWVFQIAAGSIAPGELLPSVRELAQRILVHPNTVVHAYGELEAKGILVPRRGVGMEITSDAITLCTRLREELIRKRIREILIDSTQGGLTTPEILRLMREEIKNLENGKP